MSLTVKTAPDADVRISTVAELKGWAVIEIDSDDDIVDTLLKTAADHIETRTGRRLLSQTLEWKLDDGFPSWFRLPVAPVQSVVSIKYLDETGAEQTLATSQWIADTDSFPPRIVPAVDASWPATQDRIQNVTVEFVAGYGDTHEAIPLELRQAAGFLVAHWYNYREPIITGTIVADVPLTVDSMLRPYQTPSW